MLQLQQSLRQNTKANQSVMILYVNTSGEQSTNKLNSSTKLRMTFYQPITPPAVRQVCVGISFLNEKPKAQNRAKSSLHTTGNQCSVWASKSCFCNTSQMTHTVILSELLKQPALTELIGRITWRRLLKASWPSFKYCQKKVASTMSPSC